MCCVSGRCILPATTYLELVWETLSMVTTGSIYSTVNVEFEDIRFLRATSMTPGQHIDLTIMIHYGSGQFEITENSVTVVSGLVRLVQNNLTNSSVEEEPPVVLNYPVLEKKEFYKELRLRGYHYNGLFRGVEEARGDGLRAKIKWNDNWPAFMDCMLQLNILAKDSRALYLPTRIRKIRVNSMKHTEIIGNLGGNNALLTATYDPELKLIKCGGIEIYEMIANSIVRRKSPGLEVLDAYKFLPLMPSETLTTADGLRVIIQLILENSKNSLKIDIVEVDNENASPIISLFNGIIAETPLIKAELHLLTGREINLDNVSTKNERVFKLKGNLLTIALDCLNNPSYAKETLASIEEGSFLLSRQLGSTSFTNIPHGFVLITAVPTAIETLVLLQRAKPILISEQPVIIEVLSTDLSYEWLDSLRSSIRNGPVVLVAQNDPYPGLLGLVNCLRREPDGQNLRCLIIADKRAPKFSLDNSLYRNQLNLGFAINIYRNTVWGTYRFLKLRQHLQVIPRIGHFYANVQRLGDLSSFDWFSGRLVNSSVENLVNIHYSSINFRDVMLATGRLPPEICGESRTSHECLLGLEYSGVSVNGDHLMGMVAVGALATQVEPVQYLTWNVPKDFSLRDAATIPAVYITIYYAFFFNRPVARGNTILIHAGSGGIGLAAIRVACAYGLQVFTTVSTTQKKKFILSLFPQLKGEKVKICEKIHVFQRGSNIRLV